MSSDNPSESDRLLHQVLRQWEIRDSLPPRFRERVWQRIERRPVAIPPFSWLNLLGRITQALTRPALAVSYVTVLLVAGLLAGYWQARAESARASEELSVRYVQMLDPYQMPGR